MCMICRCRSIISVIVDICLSAPNSSYFKADIMKSKNYLNSFQEASCEVFLLSPQHHHGCLQYVFAIAFTELLKGTPSGAHYFHGADVYLRDWKIPVEFAAPRSSCECVVLLSIHAKGHRVVNFGESHLFSV